MVRDLQCGLEMTISNLTKQSVLVVTVALTVWGAASERAEACSCLPPTVESSYNNSSDVFLADIGFRFTIGSTRYYFARVERTFKGCRVARDWVVLKTPVDGATCGVDLNAREHLINGHAAGRSFGLPAFTIGLCDYNQPKAELDDHDRAFLDGRNVCCGDECSCADGSLAVQCFVDPCQVAPACEEGRCSANYCGGCNAEFYDEVGYAVCESEPVAD
jgi:hypothetical protein